MLHTITKGTHLVNPNIKLILLGFTTRVMFYVERYPYETGRNTINRGRGKADPWPQWEMIMRCYPRDHTCTVLSLAEAIIPPSGDQATARTQALWAVYVATHSPVTIDQTCTVVSSPQEATELLSGDQDSPFTGRVWPR